MKLNRVILISLAGLSTLSSLVARENLGMPQGKSISGTKALSANCAPATAQTDLDINNVRTTILAGGDMWWDLANGQYEIPKVPAGSSEPKRHSLFAGSLWIGGIDAGGQLKVAAMTYRQTGNDFWPGPLNTNTVDIEAQVCNDWDKHFIMERSVVQEFVNAKASPDEYPGYVVPQSIYDWPAHGDLAFGQDYNLAPFYDSDDDGVYNPDEGDYPDYDITGQQGCDAKLYGDKTLWWVFNDKGNIHTETGAEAIGLEIHAQAFGFATNDEINNMTFYQYKVINRSTFTLKDTYFGQWVDPDLGNYTDDFVGCDVSRGLGYCYNGDENDETAAGYGVNPPAVGVDFFQGPVADAGDMIDNDLDGTVDEPGEQIIMSKFVYYNNDFSVTGNPETGTHIYNYLRGIFKDGTEMAYGGTGHQPSGTTTGILCNYMFPGDSDPDYHGTNGVPVAEWSEVTVGNVPADRRFLQSAGAFTLAPGAVNTITTGVVWARATQGGATASVDLMRLADDKAQALFDNCFRVLNGPDAPDMTVQELDKELILTLTNKATSNNYLEQYEEHDPLIISPVGENYDTTYNFEGYQIFQLANSTVTVSDVGNPDLVRLVAQCDISNGVTKLVNFAFDADLNANVPTLMVEGEDAGVRHSFHVTKDLFAEGDDALVNHKTYYFTVISYAYNNYKEYNMTDPNALDGQTKPYLAGRRNIKTYIVTPHHADVENGGTSIQSSYGTIPSMTREAGFGTGNLSLELTDETIEAVLDGNTVNPTYKMDAGPLKLIVVDPLAVPGGNFTFELHDDTSSTNDISDAYWSLTHEDGTVVYAETTIDHRNEQIIPEWGFSVDIEYYNEKFAEHENNGFISASVEFENPSAPWLTGIPDSDGANAYNWVRSGTTSNGDEYDDLGGVDDGGVYEKILGGIVAPYSLCASNAYGQAWDQFQSLNKIDSLNSIMVVITPDKDLWTRSPVVELAPETDLAVGGATKLNLREQESVDKNGNPDGTGNGMGWFPGYAIDLETGERLNIMFGENSWLEGENGADMIWNPTSNVATSNIPSSPLLGGMHTVYFMNAGKDVPAYDAGAHIQSVLGDSPSGAQKRKIMSSIGWVYGFPLADDRYNWLDNTVTIKLNVSKPYKVRAGFPRFTFNTDDIKAAAGDLSTAQDALDKINIVPNPYYGYSKYETSQVDNRVKLTNVPEKCKINIFSVNGTLIRSFDKDDNLTSLDWDLKNDSGIPIASGVYIIHIEVEGVGEKVLKWFGVLRPIDLDTF